MTQVLENIKFSESFTHYFEWIVSRFQIIVRFLDCGVIDAQAACLILIYHIIRAFK